MASTAVLVAGASTVLTPIANASPSDSSNAAARFLSGTLATSAGTLDSVVALNGVSATNNGDATPDTQSNALDATALSAINVSLPSGVQLPLGDFIALGAANQFAQASDNGVSRAASGAVDDNGVVDVSGTGEFPSSATIDIRSLLDTGDVPNTVLDTASVSTQGVTGVAALTAGGTPAVDCANLSSPTTCRDYTVADATLNVHSPLIGNVLTGATTAAGTVDDALSGLSGGLLTGLLDGVSNSLGILNGLVPGLSLVSNDLNITITSTLAETILDKLTTSRSLNGVTLDLSTGTITVDLGQIIGGLNNQPPNTPLLSAAVLSSITTSLTTLIGQVSTQLTDVLNGALDAATVHISGGVCLLEVVVCTAGLDLSYDGTLGDLLDGTAQIGVSGTGLLAIPGLDALLGSVQSNLLSGVTSSLSSGLTGLGTTITTAVDNLIDPLLDDLGPALTTIGDVLGLTLNVQESPAAGVYTEVALRASVLGAAVTTVDLGKASAGPNANELDVTATGITPNHGPAIGGTDVQISGSGFVSGVTGVTFGTTAIAPADVTVTDAGHLSVSSPPHAPGAVQVVVSNGTGLDAGPLAFTYDPVPAPTISTPTTGAVVTDTTPEIAGTGVTDHTVTVTEDSTPLCTATVNAGGTWNCSPSTPLPTGEHTITATQTDSNGNPSAPSTPPVTFTIGSAPSAPINLSAVPGDGYVSLSWTAPTNPGGLPTLGYNVYLGTTSGGEDTTTPVNGGTLVPGLGYQVHDLTNGTTYYFVVKAVNDVGESVTSNEASATPSATACPSPFQDVLPSNPFCADINWMKDNGVTKGYPGDVYKPLVDVPRGQMAAFVFRELNPGQDDPECTERPFLDVPIDNPFCGDIAWLKDNGITDGYSDDTFRPGATISRQGVAAFFFRMNHIGSPDPSCTVAPFTDVSVDNIFCGDITWMRDQGISYGTGQVGEFAPFNQTTRQAMAGLVHRMVTVLAD